MTFQFNPDRPKCKDPDCDASSSPHSLGYCTLHYQEYQENYVDYLYNSRRDRDYERRSERESND